MVELWEPQHPHGMLECRGPGREPGGPDVGVQDLHFFIRQADRELHTEMLPQYYWRSRSVGTAGPPHPSARRTNNPVAATTRSALTNGAASLHYQKPPAPTARGGAHWYQVRPHRGPPNADKSGTPKADVTVAVLQEKKIVVALLWVETVISGMGTTRETDGEWWPQPDLINKLAALAGALTGNRHDAQDVLSDTLITLWRKRALVAKADNVDAYARRVLTTRFLNDRAAAKSRNRLLLRLVSTTVPGIVDLPADAIDEADLVRSALARIPPKERTALVLRYYLDLSDRDMAAVMGCSGAAVRSYLSRGRTRLTSLIPPRPAERSDRK